MVMKAENRAEQDKASSERVESKNNLQNNAYQVKNPINDEDMLGGNIETDHKQVLSDTVEDVIKSFQKNLHPTKAECDDKRGELDKSPCSSLHSTTGSTKSHQGVPPIHAMFGCP